MAKKTGTNGKERKPRKTEAEVTEEALQALLFTHKKKLEPLLEAEKEAKAEVKKQYDLAKNEGITKKMLKTAFQLETEEGEKSLAAELAQIAQIARWMGASVGTQWEMFGDKQTAAERHFEEGRRSALNDEPAKPPAHLGQKAQQDWLEGHARGRQTLNDQRAQGFQKLGDLASDLASTATIGTEQPTHVPA